MSTQAPHRPTHATTTDSAEETVSSPAPATCRWRTWQDWVNLVLGVLLAIAPTFLAGISAGWAVTMGIIIVVVALWALFTAASRTSEWVQVAAGVVTFLAPWFGGFAAGAAGWMAWIIGVAVVALALWSMYQHRTTSS